MTYTVTAIILKREPWRDAARMYTLYTREHGKILAIGRGTRKMTSKLAAHLEPFSVSELLLARGRKVETICGAVLKRRPEALVADEGTYVAAGFAVEVVDQLVKAGERDEQLWSAIDGHLSALASGTDRSEATAGFIWRFMEHLGYRPKLDACATCDGSAEFGGLFLPVQGVVVCRDCRPDESRLVGALAIDAGIGSLSTAIAFLEARLDRPLGSLPALRKACQGARKVYTEATSAAPIIFLKRMEPSKTPGQQPPMGVMDILKKKPEPITMHLFVLMVMAVFIGAWFYFNDFSRALGKQLGEINNSLSQIQERLGLEVVPPPEAMMAEESTKYVNEEAGFSLTLPVGYHASGDAKSVYIAADPTPENETPLPAMWISISKNAPKSLSPNDRVYSKGDKTYVLMLHENLEWEHFDAVADSFE